MRLVFISDTHLRHDFEIPKGDILIHAGDLTMMGSVEEVTRVSKWLKKVRVKGGFKACVVIPGNHDWMAEKDPVFMRLMIEEAGCIYLQHQPAVVEGLRFFGSGYTPRFYDWALNVDRGAKLAALWSQIPDDTQILVTHGPPKGRLDGCPRADYSDYGTYGRQPLRYWTEHVGCADMRDRIANLKDLRIHAFGHIHRPGVEQGADGITYVNASTCDESYKAVHKPTVLEYENGKANITE
jgi:Icc-related predicted phosphoesterase